MKNHLLISLGLAGLMLLASCSKETYKRELNAPAKAKSKTSYHSFGRS